MNTINNKEYNTLTFQAMYKIPAKMCLERIGCKITKMLQMYFLSGAKELKWLLKSPG